MSSNYVPLYVFLGLLFGFGVLLPLFFSPFINENIANQESIIYPFATFITDGLSLSFVGLDAINLDFFAWLPNSAEEYMENYFNIFTYIPNFIAVPLIITMVLSLAYTIIKFFWGS